jgi:hypothetical protein
MSQFFQYQLIGVLFLLFGSQVNGMFQVVAYLYGICIMIFGLFLEPARKKWGVK